VSESPAKSGSPTSSVKRPKVRMLNREQLCFEDPNEECLFASKSSQEKLWRNRCNAGSVASGWFFLSRIVYRTVVRVDESENVALGFWLLSVVLSLSEQMFG
jgi:hypothetical protein